MHEIIIRTIKSLFIIKSLHLLNEEEKIIGVDTLDEWLLQTKQDLHFPKTSSTYINLKELFNIITNNTKQKELEIKTCHIFFGTMKSLIINI